MPTMKTKTPSCARCGARPTERGNGRLAWLECEPCGLQGLAGKTIAEARRLWRQACEVWLQRSAA